MVTHPLPFEVNHLIEAVELLETKLSEKATALPNCSVDMEEMEQRWPNLNAFALIATYFQISLCNESDGHMTRRATHRLYRNYSNTTYDPI